jgi:tetratricopeptide (TPR) repeat protein
MLAFLQGDTKAMAQIATSSAGKPGLDYRILYYQALTEQWYGRMRSARELMRRSADEALHYDTRERAAAYTADTSLFEAAVGNFAQARAGAQSAMKILSSRDVRKVDAVTLALTGDIAAAEKLAAQEEQDEFDTSARRFWLPAVRAEIALQRHDPAGALTILRAAGTIDRSNRTMLPVFLRGQARLMQHDGAGAVAEFHQYIDHRGVVCNSPWGALARLELARAYAMQGDTAKASTAYQDFLTLWKDADPDVPILKQAQAEYARLQ